MEKIKFDITKYKKLNQKKTYTWQMEALKAIDFFKIDKFDGRNKSSIFKCFKDNEHKAKISFLDCIELAKPHVKYFYKVYNSIK